MRAIWTGEITFGLVAIPVKLYSATKDLTPQFNQLHKECGTRISMVRRCPKCDRDVSWEEIGKGYEVSKGQYALFSKEELAEMEGEDAAGGIDIAEFVDPAEVDLAYIEKSYWVGPAGKSVRGFELLHKVLDETHKAAIARVKIRSRTRLGLVRPREQFFALDMMRFGDELVPSGELVVPEGKAATPRELQLARGLVEQLSADFDPARHPDSYRAAVTAAVDAKVEANEVKTDDVPEEDRAQAKGGQLIDLAELLSRSLKATANEGSPRSRKPGPKKIVSERKESKKRAGGAK